MKDKHFTLAAVGTMAVVMLVAAVYGYVILDEEELPPYVADTEQQLQMNTPPEADLAAIKRLEPILPSLTTSRKEGKRAKELSMALFGDTSAKGEDEAKEVREEAPLVSVAKAHHRATFAFVGGARKFCIIDGKFYELGEELPSGMKIQDIARDRIRIGGGGDSTWVELEKGN